MRRGRYIPLVAAAVILLLAHAACSKPKTAATLPQYAADLIKAAPAKTVCILINNPGDDLLERLPPTERLSVDGFGESMLVLPVQAGCNVKLHEISLRDGQMQERELLYEAVASPEGYVLHLGAMRPESIPHLRLTAADKTGSVTYVVAYDGKNGTPDVEYLTAG